MAASTPRPATTDTTTATIDPKHLAGEAGVLALVSSLYGSRCRRSLAAGPADEVELTALAPFSRRATASLRRDRDGERCVRTIARSTSWTSMPAPHRRANRRRYCRPGACVAARGGGGAHPCHDPPGRLGDGRHPVPVQGPCQAARLQPLDAGRAEATDGQKAALRGVHGAFRRALIFAATKGNGCWVTERISPILSSWAHQAPACWRRSDMSGIRLALPLSESKVWRRRSCRHPRVVGTQWQCA